MNRPTEEEIQKRIEEIRFKRTQFLLAAWEMMRKRYRELEGRAFLAQSLVVQVVESYLQDRCELVARDNISGRIQLHKIAGLMAAAIIKTKPIQLRDDVGRDARVSMDNETFAILHGLAICSEGDKEAMLAVFKAPMFATWYEDFIYQIRLRHDCGPWCSMIFETLSLTYFPKNLDRISGRSE